MRIVHYLRVRGPTATCLSISMAPHCTHHQCYATSVGSPNIFVYFSARPKYVCRAPWPVLSPHATILTYISTVGDAFLRLQTRRIPPARPLAGEEVQSFALVRYTVVLIGCSIMESSLHISWIRWRSTPILRKVHHSIPLHPVACGGRCLELFTTNLAPR